MIYDAGGHGLWGDGMRIVCMICYGAGGHGLWGDGMRIVGENPCFLEASYDIFGTNSIVPCLNEYIPKVYFV